MLTSIAHFVDFKTLDYTCHVLCNVRCRLKMIGLYLYTLIIGHKSCNMLSILNKLTLQEKLQTFMINNVFLDKKSKNTTTTKQKIKHKNPCRSQEPGTSWTQSECVTTAPPSQLSVSFVVKQFNLFDAMGRNVNKQSFCRPNIFNKYMFLCNIFTCMNTYIWQFLIFTEVCFAA